MKKKYEEQKRSIKIRKSEKQESEIQSQYYINPSKRVVKFTWVLIFNGHCSFIV